MSFENALKLTSLKLGLSGEFIWKDKQLECLKGVYNQKRCCGNFADWLWKEPHLPIYTIPSGHQKEFNEGPFITMRRNDHCYHSFEQHNDRSVSAIIEKWYHGMLLGFSK